MQGDPTTADERSSPNPAPPGEIVLLPVEHADGPFGEAGADDRRLGTAPLRGLLVGLDLLALAVAWALAITMPGLVPVDSHGEKSLWLLASIGAVAAAAQLLSMAQQRLYLARVNSVRVIELVKLARSTVVAFATVLIYADAARLNLGFRRALIGAALSYVLLAATRGVYTNVLRHARAQGRYTRGVVIVGANDEGLELQRLLSTHPELGFRVNGVTGLRAEHQRWPVEIPFLGTIDQTLAAVAGTRSNGVLVATSALDASQLNVLARQMLDNGIHVHLSSGLRGIAHQRLRAVPLAHEPMYYLEPVTLSKAQIGIKRVIDVAIALVALVLFAPVLAVAALAIKFDDRGPVFFRQERVGRDGKTFKLLKLRTMVPDAEARLADVRRTAGNQRESILFKLDRDPRRTRVGRYLEAASLDEIPQLFNVLRGTMSLVGPRPALPSEVAQFDDELLARLSVPPGITGLWQVEARDNPSFDAYRRLDLFYVENWSVSLDLVLLLETAISVVARMFRSSSAEEAGEKPGNSGDDLVVVNDGIHQGRSGDHAGAAEAAEVTATGHASESGAPALSVKSSNR